MTRGQAKDTAVLEPLLTSEEVAAILKVTPEFVWSAVHRGHLKAVRLNTRAQRFKQSDVASYIAERYR